MHYAASTVPIMRESKVLQWNPNARRSPKEVSLNDAFQLIGMLQEGDHLWIAMGSTNAAVALGAYRRGVEIHQVSYIRALPVIPQLRQGNGDAGGRKVHLTPQDILSLAQLHAGLFYPFHVRQAEVLEISAAWQAVEEAMEARKAYANLVRSRMQRQAVIFGRVNGNNITTKEELAQLIELEVGVKDPVTKRKREPNDPHMQAFLEREEEARRQIESITRRSKLYHHIFGSIEGVGPMIAVRFIADIERIERFERAEDLSNYAGMLPRGSQHTLPARKRSKGEPLSRSPRLNSACFLFQDQMFQWGRNTPLGQRLAAQVDVRCPCTADQRKQDKDLRRKHAEAVKQARIATTRYFLEQLVWPRWREYMGITS